MAVAVAGVVVIVGEGVLVATGNINVMAGKGIKVVVGVSVMVGKGVKVPVGEPGIMVVDGVAVREVGDAVAASTLSDFPYTVNAAINRPTRSK